MTFTGRWFAAACAASALFIASAAGWLPDWLGTAALCALVAATAADLLAAPRRGQLTVQRTCETHAGVGDTLAVGLELRCGAARVPRLRALVRDTVPEGLAPSADPLPAWLAPHRNTTVQYATSLDRRGDYTWGDVHVRLHAPLGLVTVTHAYEAPHTLSVYPGLREAARYLALTRRGRLQQMGVHRARVRGAGRQFESLRDYVQDDEYRRIDWKASARRGRLISREYEVERSQTVLLLLDVGRSMAVEVDGSSKAEHAMAALLTLAQAAADAGDHVGMLVFADTVKAWVSPRRGKEAVFTCLEALHATRPTLAEPDYRSAFAHMRARWRKRSMVVCFTDLWDPDSSHEAIQQISGLMPRHLPLCATYRDSTVMRCASAEIAAPADAYARAVALQVLEDRHTAVAELRRRGVMVVDAPAEKLTADLINSYLTVKSRSML